MADRPIECRPPEDGARQLQAQEVRARLTAQSDNAADPKPQREIPQMPWYRGNVVLAIFPLAAIVVFNTFIVLLFRNDPFLTCFSIILVPTLNVVLGAILMACVPLIRNITGWSAKLHVAITLVGIPAAIALDIAILFGYLR